MALEIPTPYFEGAFHHQQAGTTRPAVVTQGFLFPPDDHANVAAEVAGAWHGFMGKLCNSITYTRFTLRSAEGLVYEKGYSTTGGDSDPGAPYSVAFLVKKSTQIPGRHAQGRMFLPGVADLTIDSAGRISQPKFSALQQGLNDLYATWISVEAIPVILHAEKPTGPSGHSPTVVTSLILQSVVATQRHRLRR